MNREKEQILETIRCESQREAERLAGDFVRAASAEREEILAALEFERWLAGSCLDVLEHGRHGPGR